MMCRSSEVLSIVLWVASMDQMCLDAMLCSRPTKVEGRCATFALILSTRIALLIHHRQHEASQRPPALLPAALVAPVRLLARKRGGGQGVACCLRR